MMMTGISGCSRLTVLRMSMPSIWLSLSQMSRIRRPGGSDRMAAIASSELAARRVSKPSSPRMSEITSRMSRSSSTIRMSLIPPSLGRRGPCTCFFAAMQRQAHHRPRPDMRARGERVGILQHQRAAMFLDDLLDDRQAQPGALLARCHVGLEQPRAVLRKADAVIGNGDHRLAVLGAALDADCRYVPVGRA